MNFSCEVTIEGNFFDQTNSLARNTSFDVLKKEGRRYSDGTTTENGTYSVSFKIPCTTFEHQIPIIFRQIEQYNNAYQIPNMTEKVAKQLSHLKVSTVKEFEIMVPVNGERVHIKIDVYMDKKHEKKSGEFKYLTNLAEAVIPSEFRGVLEKVKESVDIFDIHGTKEMVEAFGFTSIPLTPENTWKLITQGVCPLLMKDTDTHYIASYNGDRLPYRTLDLPNVTVYFKKHEDINKIPKLEKIELQYRKTKEPSNDHYPIQTITPKDKNFTDALRTVNGAFLLYGEVVHHLGIGHIIPGEYAEAINIFLPGTLIGEKLLLPLSKMIQEITFNYGDALISGVDGFLALSPVPVEGIAKWIKIIRGSFCPFTWSPEESKGKKDYFANVNNHHFYSWKKKIHEFFESNNNWAKTVKEDWVQLHLMFDFLHKDSPVYQPYEGVPEIYNKNAPERTKYSDSDKGPRNFRPVAKNLSGPSETDREMIENFCLTYAQLVTFWHSWIHRSQYLENSKVSPHVADPNFAPINPTMTDYVTIRQLTLASVFRYFQKSIVEDYSVVVNKEILPSLREEMIRTKDVYEKNKIKIEEIAAGTVI